MACTALVPASALAAEANVFTLGEVHVAAPAEADAPGEAVLTQDEMRLLDRDTLDEALNAMAGVAISQSGNQRNERNYFVRGNDRWRVPLYIDGIRVYLPADNRIDTARFTTADIAEIQVTKGYTSVINGPGAMGGSVNLVSRRVAKEVEGEVRSGVTFDGNGAFNGLSEDLFVGTMRDKWYVQGSGSWSQKDHYRLSDNFSETSVENGGNRDQSDTKDYKVNFKVGYVPRAGDEYSVNFIRQDGEKSAPANTNLGATANRYWKWPEWRKQSLYWLSNTTFDGGTTVKVRAYYDWMENGIDFYDDATYTTRNNTNFGVNSKYRDRAFGGTVQTATPLLAGRDTIRTALHARRDIHRERNMYNERDGAVGTPLSRQYEPWQQFVEDTYSGALENTYKLTPQWDLTGAVSYDYRHLSQAEDWVLSGVSGGANNAGSWMKYELNDDQALNPQLSTVYRYSNTGSINAAIEQRTRFPTLFERYSTRFGGAASNPNLQAERANNAQIGVKQQVGQTTNLGASVFYSYIQDAITNFLISAPNTYQSRNIGSARHKGIELEASTLALPNLEIGGNYTLLQAEPADKSVRLTNIPRHKALIYADWEARTDFHVVPSVELSSERWMQDSVSNAYYRGGRAVVSNLKLAYKPLDSLTLEAGAKNIFDADYATTDGYPEEGRNYFANVRVTF